MNEGERDPRVLEAGTKKVESEVSTEEINAAADLYVSGGSIRDAIDFLRKHKKSACAQFCTRVIDYHSKPDEHVLGALLISKLLYELL